MNKRLYLMSAALMLIAVTALSQSQSQPSSQATRPEAVKTREAMKSLSSSDRRFVNDAHEGGVTEVAMGRLGVTRAMNPDVKAFAQLMIDDHSKADQELMQIASGKGITLSNPPPPSAPTSSTDQPSHLSGKQREMMDRLNKLSGADFDREYIKNQLKDHEKDVPLFEKQATSGSDPELKAFAAKTLPTLRAHLQQARDLAGKVGATDPKAAPKTSNSSPERSKP